MIDPLFWLGLSILLVAVSLTAVLVVALPVLQEIARAARSVEKLADTLRRELPPTLEAIRLTGLEISDLTDDVSEGVKSAGQVVKQVDQNLSSAKNQAQKVQVNTRGVVAGVKAAWKTWRRPSAGRRSIDRLPPSQRTPLEFRELETSSPMSSTSPPNNLYQEPDADYEEEGISGDSLSRKQHEDLEPDETTDN
ncbi:MAG TPA: hypothetical protein DCE56_04790 [Cyanobacteria bacterium UBA8553]|nr:hypothetical protein [Cyanobacteria bacterium UBA8553]HAJ61387.1 hypothetical protein [Cyanobacteria bacterium UBA8543]